jgi:hypothetical protein
VIYSNVRRCTLLVCGCAVVSLCVAYHLLLLLQRPVFIQMVVYVDIWSSWFTTVEKQVVSSCLKIDDPVIESKKRPRTDCLQPTDCLIRCAYCTSLVDTHRSVPIYLIPRYGRCHRCHFIRLNPNPNPLYHKMLDTRYSIEYVGLTTPITVSRCYCS